MIVGKPCLEDTPPLDREEPLFPLKRRRSNPLVPVATDDGLREVTCAEIENTTK